MRRIIWIPLVLGLCLAAVPAKAVDDWTSIGPEGGHIPALEADPQQPGVLYAGTESGAFKSVDGGATWFRASEGLKRNRIIDIEVDPSDSSVVYAASPAGLFVSNDGGATWSGPLLHERYLSAVAVDPRNPRRIWAGGQGLWLSNDGGATWNGFDDDLIALVMDIVLDPFDPETLYLATLALEDYGTTGVVRSTDGGATWVDTTAENWPSFFNDNGQLAVDPTTPGMLYLSFLELTPEYDEVTWRSTDRGTTWQRTEGGFPIAVDRHGVVYAGDMRSTDHGATWQPGTLPPDFPVRFAVSAAGDGTLWAGTRSLGVFRSEDSGALWQPARNHLHATTVSSFAINPRRPSVIYAGASTAGVWKTFDGGADWTWAGSGLPADVLGINSFASQVLGIDPRRPQTLYLSWFFGGLARTDDGGAHWTMLREKNPLSALHTFEPLQIAVDPGASNIVYLTGQGVGDPDEHCVLARSEDRGETFECVPPFRHDGAAYFAKRVFFDPNRPATVWVPEERQRFWKSSDHGEHWKAVRARGLERAGDPVSLAIAPSGVLFLGTNYQLYDDRPERIWRSDDGGRSWKAWGRGLPPRSMVNELLIDTKKPNILYAAVRHYDSNHETNASGVYWSRDGGKTFRPAGLSGNVYQLTLDPKVPGKIYASVGARGIYTLTRP